MADPSAAAASRSPKTRPPTTSHRRAVQGFFMIGREEA